MYDTIQNLFKQVIKPYGNQTQSQAMEIANTNLFNKLIYKLNLEIETAEALALKATYDNIKMYIDIKSCIEASLPSFKDNNIDVTDFEGILARLPKPKLPQTEAEMQAAIDKQVEALEKAKVAFDVGT